MARALGFQLLGPVQVQADGIAHPVGTVKQQLTLAALLIERGGTFVPLDTLARRIWDIDLPAKPEASIWGYIHHLRALIARLGLPASIEVNRGVGYRLQVEPDQVDAHRLTALADQARDAEQAGHRDQALALLIQAQALVAGEPLAGLPGPWAASARARLREHVRHAAITRLGWQLGLGRAADAAAELRALSEQHPLDETVAELLLRALAATGRRGEALAYFQRFDRRLRHDRGIGANKPLSDALQQLLSAPSKPALTRAVAPTVNTLEAEPPGFVGRRTDLEYLAGQIADRHARGEPAVCLITGMPGVGKTSLALHLAHRLHTVCPDGAIQLSFHSHNQQPTALETVLTLALETLHAQVPDPRDGADTDRLLAAWRRHVAGRGSCCWSTTSPTPDRSGP